jgi:hypothetical protein
VIPIFALTQRRETLLNKIDWGFVGLLAFGVLGHTYGSFTLLEIGSGIFVWSLAGVLAASLVVCLNALRILRPGDLRVAWMALVGSLGWLLVAILFGRSLGNALDPRSMYHALAALGLVIFSLRSVLAKRVMI